MSELPVQGEVLRAPTEAGGKMPAMMIPVLSGAKTNACHAVATRRRIHTGALVVLEVAGVHKRFHVNAARAFSLGEPSPEVQRQMPYLSPTDTTPVEGSSVTATRASITGTSSASRLNTGTFVPSAFRAEGVRNPSRLAATALAPSCRQNP